MDAELKPWVELIESLSSSAVNLTMGLIAGSRAPIARAVLDRLAVAGLDGIGRRGLLIRMNLGSDALPKRQLRAARTVEQSPTVIGAPLGKWSEVTIPMRLGMTAPPTLEQLPRWLSGWKRDYSRILLDLGPLDQPICRTVGRYCDATMLILGPETCASPTWLRRHIDHLTECDTSLTGSLLVSASHAA